MRAESASDTAQRDAVARLSSLELDPFFSSRSGHRVDAGLIRQATPLPLPSPRPRCNMMMQRVTQIWGQIRASLQPRRPKCAPIAVAAAGVRAPSS